MTPAEAWTLAPCEITRFLEARGDAAVEDRFAMGYMMAQAFNAPKELPRALREYRDAKLARKAQQARDGSDLITFFRRTGATIIDETL